MMTKFRVTCRAISLLLMMLAPGFTTGCSRQQEPRTIPKEFQGRFISDKEATERFLRTESGFAPDLIERIVKLLGKTTVEVTDQTMTLTSGKYRETEILTVLERGKNHLVVRSYSNLYKTNYTAKVVLDGDGYWTSSDFPFKGFKERFKRLQ